MKTQQNPTRPLARVFFQVGQVAIDDYGYDVIDSINDEAELPAEGLADHLQAHVAQHYQGWELIDWVEAGSPFVEF